MADYNYYLWIEIQANKHRISDRDYFNRILDRCLCAGIGTIILSVKDTTGFGIFKSSLVPHYSKYDSCLEETDYLHEYVEMAHKKGLKLLAAVDVFAEGNTKAYHPLSPGYANTEWQTRMYGIDGKGDIAIKSVTDIPGMQTADSIDDFGEIFVNPVRDDVKEYELGVIKEIVDNYDIDGIVLDRVRFIGLGSDFSDYTRNKFEEYIGERVQHWPEDIYSLEKGEREPKISEGPLFGKWITFRAGVIKSFIIKAGEIVAKHPGIEFLDYIGSWYPLYYTVGANWASSRYIPDEYPFVQKEEYSGTGYAEFVDKLISGFYFPEITIHDAIRLGKPAYWYSVEGSGDTMKKVVGGVVPFVGSLFLEQYKGRPDVFMKAVDMCFKKSQGCMLFDLCYIEEYDWWKYCEKGD